MLKKATVLLIVLTLVVSFSMTAFASGATVTVCEETGAKTIENPAEPVANETARSNGNGQGPDNPIYVAGD